MEVDIGLAGACFHGYMFRRAIRICHMINLFLYLSTLPSLSTLK